MEEMPYESGLIPLGHADTIMDDMEEYTSDIITNEPLQNKSPTPALINRTILGSGSRTNFTHILGKGRDHRTTTTRIR